jgi:hypothetical protein
MEKEKIDKSIVIWNSYKNSHLKKVPFEKLHGASIYTDSAKESLQNIIKEFRLPCKMQKIYFYWILNSDNKTSTATMQIEIDVIGVGITTIEFTWQYEADQANRKLSAKMIGQKLSVSDDEYAKLRERSLKDAVPLILRHFFKKYFNIKTQKKK